MNISKPILLFIRYIYRMTLLCVAQFMHYFYRKNLGAMSPDADLDRSTSLRGHLNNIFLGNVQIDRGVVLNCDVEDAQIHIGDGTFIREGAMLLTYGGDISIGKKCSVHPYCVFYGQGGLTIGDYVRIATHTVIVPANHNFDDLDEFILNQGSTRQGVVIEDDVWIGAGVKILDGCRIGRGSVIGAGTVVTKSVEPYSVVVGVPGKVIRKRGEIGQTLEAMEKTAEKQSLKLV